MILSLYVPTHRSFLAFISRLNLSFLKAVRLKIILILFPGMMVLPGVSQAVDLNPPPVLSAVPAAMKFEAPTSDTMAPTTMNFDALTRIGAIGLHPSDTSSVGAEKGKRVLVLSPSPDNKRNSEGAFITLRDGRVLFIYTHYGSGGNGDHDIACLMGRISGDGGKTWSEKDQLILENEGAMNIMSVSLLRLHNGSIALFYLRKNSTEDCIPVMRLSADEGKRWGPPVDCITDRKGYFVLNNDRAIQLSGGRILLPVALHKVPGDPTWNNKAKLFCYYSDDNGKSWKAGSQVPDTTAIITQEPGVVERKDGKVMMFIRASGGYQQLSLSADRGVTWSPIRSMEVASPLSPASIKKIPSTGDWLMVWNHNDGSLPETKGERTPLTVAVSRDEGKSWDHVANLETDPDGWYCYTAIHFHKKHVLLGYCAGSQKAGTHLDVAAIRRIRIKELYR